MEKFNFKKSLGQNFLKDENIINNIVEKCSIDNETLVIEVGPGNGALTTKIIKKCKNLICFEIDKRLEEVLNSKLSLYDNYEIIIDNFLKVDVLSYIKKYSYKKLYFISNLPYYITTPIITKLIDEKINPDKIVVMMQKEVADRFTAKPNSRDYNSLTVFLNYYYDIKKIIDVSRNCFIPRPNVDSSVIELNLKQNKLFVKDINIFNKLIKDSFKFKRKTLKNNLYEYNLNIISLVLKKYNFDLSVRAESITLEMFVDISNNLI